MKFMKLGSKPDTFYTTQVVRSVSCEVSTDLIIQIKGITYLLHKFPLLSKCSRLQRLCTESPDSSHHQIVQLHPNFPGGIEAFEVCAKFCYGITITLSANNIVAVWCAAEYLQMTEDLERGNLISKIEKFFNSCILHGLKDSVLTLQTTKTFSTWSKDLLITSRCIEAISSKVLTNPSKIRLQQSKSWWGEDIAELGIDLYWRTMIGIKSGGKVPNKLIGEALQIYASRWFPAKQTATKERKCNHKLVLEAIVSLLPAEKGTVPCSFLLKLLKAANKLGVSASSKMELARRAGIQLEDATVKDLLIPLSPEADGTTMYDVDIVKRMLEQFISQGCSPPTSPPRVKGRLEKRRSRSADNIDLLFEESRRSSSASHSSKLRVAKLTDGYLQEIARDVNLPLAKMISIAESIPSFARVDHDDLYSAIDTYLQAHPNLSKRERKRLCGILDCKRLSMEACMDAARNELLPLRVVLQLLFHDHIREASVLDLPANIKALVATQDDENASSTHPAEDQWSVSGPSKANLKTKLGSNGLGVHCLASTRPKRMFSKLLSMNRGAREKR